MRPRRASSEITEPSERRWLEASSRAAAITSSSRSSVVRTALMLAHQRISWGGLASSLIPHRVKLCSPKVEVGQTLASLCIRLLVDMNITNHAIKRAKHDLAPNARTDVLSHPIR